MRYTTRICGAVLTTAVAILPLRAGAAELRHQWTFNDGSSDDQVGGADGLLEGGASVVDGRLFLDGSPGSRMLTLPLEEPLAAKSLVAWANPSDLTQRGGSILTIEDSPQGDVFDAIVAFEAAPRVWLNGSNGFQRTNPQNGGAEETATCPEQVLMAVVYDEDNTITIYRNGEVYVPPEVATTGALQTFDEFAVVQIGARHGTHNDVFRGFVDEARVYDGALTADEVAGLFEEGPEESVPIESCELGPCEGDTAAVELRHQWTFDDGTADDLVGDAHGQLEGGATIADGQLALDGTPGSRMLTLPLGEELCTKTLVAWVSPSNLIQRGGSVLTIEDSPQGDVFDAIVAFETQPRVWLNGSNFFERTNTANGGAAETTVCPEEVLVAVVYGPGDDVTIYRNGELYVGAEVATVGTLQPFGEEAVVQIGARHGTHNDVFDGSINEARVYQGALSADDIAGLHAEGPEGAAPPIESCPEGPCPEEEDETPELIGQWTFNDDTAADEVGGADGFLEGEGIEIVDGRLSLSGVPGSRMITSELGEALCAKSLVAWVSPATLEQRGGSVLTVEDTPAGVVFDAIVAFEVDAGRWINGSNNFLRTEPANGGELETAVDPEEVFLAVTYALDGTITLYRDGELYADPALTSKGGLQLFEETAVVQIGARHGTHNDVFVGFVNEARVYRGALDADNVADIFDEGPAGTEPPQQPFKRGDVDGNGLLDITDPIRNLTFQFIGLPGGEQPTCLDALDDDGNNQIEITDPITSLQIQFVGGAPVDPGFESCGPDNDNDPILGCEAYPAGSCE